MRVIVTAGPTREYVDTVRFISNGSSGRMGCAVARAAAAGGHDVTVLLGPGVDGALREGLDGACRIVPFVSTADLKRELLAVFADCDALIMVAAVGDFRLDRILPSKLHRAGGPVTLKLFPTEDVVGSVAAGKRDGQIVITFAVEDGSPDEIEAKARSEMVAKNANFVVVNTPAAMEADESDACILTRHGFALPWARRAKTDLADRIVHLVRESRSD